MRTCALACPLLYYRRALGYLECYSEQESHLLIGLRQTSAKLQALYKSSVWWFTGTLSPPSEAAEYARQMGLEFVPMIRNRSASCCAHDPQQLSVLCP